MSELQHKFQDRRSHEAGFTLIELLVAAVIFTIISGAAFSLVAQHQPIFNQQQNLAEVNIALRNAVAQMQLDLANAGSNYYAEMGANVPYFPVGIVITNNVVATGTDCRTGTPAAYTASCFDQMSIISVDSNTPKASPAGSTGGSSCINTTSGTAYLEPAGSIVGYGSGAAGLAAAQAAAAHYLYSSTGYQDQILFVNNAGTSYTTAKLAAAPTTPQIAGNYYVLLTYGATLASGQNTAGSANDIYNISTNTPNPTSLLQRWDPLESTCRHASLSIL